MPTGTAPSPADVLRGGTVEAARARILAAAEVLTPQTVRLSESLGRVLTEPVLATRDQPPFAASAMDGWAVRGSDLADGAAILQVVGESAAGHPFDAGVASGEAVRISTGAPLPMGADRVVIQEEATLDGDRVRLAPASAASSHVRARGSDFATDDLLLPSGLRIDAWRLALAAAAGRDRLTVARRPRVAILSTGEEIVMPGADPGPSAIFNSGGPGLAALVEGWGGEPLLLAPAGDSRAAVLAAVEGVEADVLVTIGGASVGDHDLVKPSLGALGLDLHVETVNVRPGKPVWFGVLADGRRVLGLPGNPASAFVCAELFLKPLLAAMQGADPEVRLVAVRLRASLKAEGPREHWLRAKIDIDDEGGVWASPFPDQDSAMVGVFAQADALLRRPARAAAARDGDLVDALLLRRA